MSNETPFSEESELKETASSRLDEPTTAEPMSESPIKPAMPSSRPENQPNNAEKTRKDFYNGILINLLVNGVPALIYFCYLGYETFAVSEGARYSVDINFLMRFGGIWMLANLIIMILLALRHPEILKGMVAGYALIFFITLILGLCLTAFCLNIA